MCEQEKPKKTLWIRPVYKDDGRVLISQAVCTTNLEITVDSMIIEHFEKDEPGVDIEKAAMEFFDATEVKWGKPINVK